MLDDKQITGLRQCAFLSNFLVFFQLTTSLLGSIMDCSILCLLAFGFQRLYAEFSLPCWPGWEQTQRDRPGFIFCCVRKD